MAHHHIIACTLYTFVTIDSYEERKSAAYPTDQNLVQDIPVFLIRYSTLIYSNTRYYVYILWIVYSYCHNPDTGTPNLETLQHSEKVEGLEGLQHSLNLPPCSAWGCRSAFHQDSMNSSAWSWHRELQSKVHLCLCPSWEIGNQQLIIIKLPVTSWHCVFESLATFTSLRKSLRCIIPWLNFPSSCCEGIPWTKDFLENSSAMERTKKRKK